MASPDFVARPGCRGCGHDPLTPVVSFGATPISDKIRTAPASVDPAPKLPLELMHCPACGLSQLSIDVDPAYLYGDDYPYYSSFSPQLSAHFQASAEALIATAGFGPGSVVIEAASNDGCLLRHFHAAGARTIGFDPAEGPARVAAGLGIDARPEFFTEDLAQSLREQGLRADLFLANNVLAHVPDLTGFVRGIAAVLAPGGMAVIEVPYFADLVDKREYDTIYHQHLCYFLVTPLARLFAGAGLCLLDVRHLPIHGGSLRLFLGHGSQHGAAAQAFMDREADLGLTGVDYARQVGDGARHVRDRLNRLVDGELAAGRRLRAYAAAGKATTQLAYCGLDADRLGCVADLNTWKHGKYMPGTDLKIVSRERMLAEAPDTILILAWNFADEIIRQLREEMGYRGRFIVPLPEPVLL